MRLDPAAGAILLSPHLDDAALSCWHLLLDPNVDLAIATVFAGIPAAGCKGRYDQGIWQGFEEVRSALGGDWDSRQMSLHRRKEDLDAIAPTGRRSYHLDTLDAQHGISDEDTGFSPFAEGLEGHVAECSRLYLPAAVPPAFSTEANIDHVLTKRWGERLAGRRIPINYYVDLPYAFRDDGNDWVDELSLPNVERQHLSDDQIQSKLAALQRYATQWPVLTATWERNSGIALADRETWRFEAVATSQCVS
jgi:hypothetical protein